MPPKKKGIRKRARPRNEANDISPSTDFSPALYDESQSHDYPDKDEVEWREEDTDLSKDQIGAYVESTKHLKQDTVLSILRDSFYDISSAVAKCAQLEEIPDLSLLETRVLLAASPVPYTVVDGNSEAWIDPEKHVHDLLPRVQPSVIMDYYKRIGREDCMPPRGWLPNVDGLGSMKIAGLVTKKDDSPLHKQQDQGRSLRSSAVTPVLPRKVEQRDNLDGSMAGFDERTSTEDDLSTQHYSIPFLILNRNGTRLIERKRSLSPMKSSYSPPEKRGRSSNYLPIHPSPLILGESSIPSSFLPHDSSPSTSSSSSAAEEFTLRKKRNPLEIAMNWSPRDNRSGTRRTSRNMMENHGENKKAEPASGFNRFAKMLLDVDNDGPIEMMDVDEGGREAVTADPRSDKQSERADDKVWDERETSVKPETDTINSNSHP